MIMPKWFNAASWPATVDRCGAYLGAGVRSTFAA